MQDGAQVRSMADEVSKLSTADRGIDFALAKMSGTVPKGVFQEGGRFYTKGYRTTVELPTPTSCCDDSTAILAKFMPGWNWSVTSARNSDGLVQATLVPPAGSKDADLYGDFLEGYGKTAALAVLKAVLTLWYVKIESDREALPYTFAAA
jgi:hypothetical protein